MSECKYPNVKIKLIGEDGNAFSIMGRVTRALKQDLREQYSCTEINDIVNKYLKEAESGDYNHLLITTMNWVSCDEDDECEEEDYNDYDDEDYDPDDKDYDPDDKDYDPDDNN
jgi:hypothetical protein